MSYDSTIEYFSLPVNDNELEIAVRRMNLILVLCNDSYEFVYKEISILTKLDRALYSPRYAKLISDIMQKLSHDIGAIDIGVKGITKDDIEFVIPILDYIDTSCGTSAIFPRGHEKYGYEFDDSGDYISEYNDSHDVWEGLVFAISMIASNDNYAEIILHGDQGETYGARAGKDKDGKSYIEWIERVNIIYKDPEYYTIDGCSINWKEKEE